MRHPFRSLLPLSLLTLASVASAQQTFTPSLDGLTVENTIPNLQALVWQRCAEGMTWNGTTCAGTHTPLTWVAALVAANAANREGSSGRNGFSDWYVPPGGELGRLWSTTAPVGVPAAFPATPATSFVSSTVFSFFGAIINALGTNFSDGSSVNIALPADDANTDTYAARLVRAPGATYYTVTGTIQPAAGASWVNSNTFNAPEQGSVLLDYTVTPGWRYTGVSVTGGNGPSCVYSHVTLPTTGVVVAMLQSNCTATLSFARITWPVTVTAPPASEGSINCPATVNEGDTLTCTVSPEPGYQLAAWGDDCAPSGSSASCSVANVTSAKTVSATFALSPATVTVTQPPTAQGTISCPATVPMGGTLSCTALTGAGYVFAGWGGDCAASGTTATCSVAGVSRNLAVSARFARAALPVTVTQPPIAQGSISCPTTVPVGAALVCTARAAAGYELQAWGGTCAPAGSASTCIVAGVSTAPTVTARFRALAPVAVPTLGEWGLVLMGLLMAGVGAGALRRRRGKPC